MTTKINVYSVGDYNRNESLGYSTKYDEYSVKRCGDLVFQKSSSKNMDKLWTHFYKHESYPEFYLGIAKRVAICKCPHTGEEDWFNGERCLSIESPEIGSTVTVSLNIKTRKYTRDFIFIGWATGKFHEWQMTKGTVLQLEQGFIDRLDADDKRYLKMNR